MWRAVEPLVSLEVLSNRIVLMASSAMFLVQAANVGLTVYLPVYAQAYLGLSPARSGYALLGFLLGTVVGAAISGRLVPRVTKIKFIAASGAALSGIAFIVTGALAAQTSLVTLEILLILIGVSMGMAFPVTTISVQNGVDQMHLGVATGTLTFLRSLGSAIGVCRARRDCARTWHSAWRGDGKRHGDARDQCRCVLHALLCDGGHDADRRCDLCADASQAVAWSARARRRQASLASPSGE